MTISAEQLKSLAQMLPKPTTGLGPAKRGRGTPFDLDAWVTEHGLPVVQEKFWQGGRLLILNPCPFDSAHTNRSAWILQQANGAIAAGCHHSSCQGKGWYELRDILEPGWREKRKIGKHGPSGEDGSTYEPIIVRLADVAPEDVSWLWEPYIPMGKLTILEGDPGMGKTWAALAIIAAITTGTELLGQEGDMVHE
jgi:hypothetical protein